MAKFLATSVYDSGLNDLTSATTMHVISSYTAGDTYANVIAASLGSNSVTVGAVGDGSGSNSRKRTVPAVNVTATGASATPDLHIALVNTAGTKVYAVTKTPNQPIAIGNILQVAAFDIQFNQPSQV